MTVTPLYQELNDRDKRSSFQLSKKLENEEKLWIKHVLISPPLLFFAIFAIFPLIYTLYVSLSDWTISGPHRFIGLQNYRDIFSSLTFRQSFRNTMLFAIITVALQYILGLTIALLVFRSKRGVSMMRLMFLIPMMFTPVVVGFVWRTLFDPGYGPINYLLGRIGITGIPWLSEPIPAFLSVVIADTWQWTPFMFLILYASLRSLPTAPLEAAVVDGASEFRLFVDHIFPMLIPASITAILLRSIEAFKLFDVIYLLTGGGPGNSTATVSLNAYYTGLKNGNLGSAAAMTLTLLVVILVLLTIILRLLGKGNSSGAKRRKVIEKRISSNSMSETSAIESHKMKTREI
jgi:multiple sugar transport system permease protein